MESGSFMYWISDTPSKLRIELDVRARRWLRHSTRFECGALIRRLRTADSGESCDGDELPSLAGEPPHSRQRNKETFVCSVKLFRATDSGD